MGFLSNIFGGKTESNESPTLQANEYLDEIKKIVDPSSAFASEAANEIILKSKDDGEIIVGVLDSCLNEVFATRAEMSLLIYTAREVAQTTLDLRLISTLEKILVEGSELRNGRPTPPTWMPQLRPVIAGEGRYGWDDGTWIKVAHPIAESLLDIVPKLTAKASTKHSHNLANAINHYIARLKGVRGSAYNEDALEKEISYWQSLASRVESLETISNDGA